MITLSERDLANLYVLMAQFADEEGENASWKKLLARQWPSLSTLIDACQDHICPQDRKDFRDMVDLLWVD